MFSAKSVFAAAAVYFASSAAAECLSWQMFNYYAAMPDGTVFEAIIQPGPTKDKAKLDPVCSIKTSNRDDLKTVSGRMFSCDEGWGASLEEGLERFAVNYPGIADPWKPDVHEVDWNSNDIGQVPFISSAEGESGC